MKFSVDGDVISFSGDRPGNHAALLAPGGRACAYIDGVFDDRKPWYTWSFRCVDALAEGDRVVFSTVDYEVLGVVRDGQIAVSPVEDVPQVRVDADVPSPRGITAEVVQPKVTVISSGAQRPSSPKVSVVTCAYNRPEMLREAVESLRAQTDPDWEHLIYDNGSTDPGVADVLAWAAEDVRVRVWRGEKNIDQPARFWNFLYDRALGRYFTVLDDDNTKLPRFVEVMAGKLDGDPTLDVVTCGWLVRRDGRVPDEYYLNLTTNSARLDVGSSCDGGAVLYRREVFERAGYFSEVMRTNEDWDWLRRAVHVSKVENLHECHSTYRCHEVQRMTRSGALGSDADIVRLKSRPLRATLGVRVVRPPTERLTRSQEDVCVGIDRALSAIPWVVQGDDVALVVSPFQMTDEEILERVEGCDRVASLHMEDPYALVANLDRVRHMGSRTWVVTNDVSTVSEYRALVGDRVVVCPSLSTDSSIASPSLMRDIDVLLCGYAYPSRQRFVDDLLPRLRGLRVCLVGDGWEGRARGPGDGPVETMGTLSSDLTYVMHARARAVICLHRVHGDCSDGPTEPETVNRGFMEGRSGARVFLDRSRGHHHLDDGDVVWYDSPVDLADKLRACLDAPRDAKADVFSVKCLTLYTYRARLAKILNCVREDRRLAEIP